MPEPDPRAALENVLLVALCRPTMMWGVPAEGLMINLGGSVLVGAWVGMGTWHPLLYWVVAIPVVHMIMRVGVARDHNWFRCKKLGFETKGYATETWGGSTVTPLSRGLPRRGRDLPVAL